MKEIKLGYNFRAQVDQDLAEVNWDLLDEAAEFENTAMYYELLGLVQLTIEYADDHILFDRAFRAAVKVILNKYKFNYEYEPDGFSIEE